MELPSYFTDFLKNIEPTKTQIDQSSTGHTTLRDRLASDKEFKDYYEHSFLQGSYRRSTAIKPVKDVDIVVMANLDYSVVTPKEAISLLRNCLSNYYNNVTTQNRSVNIELTYINMDVVIAIGPNGKDSNLLIPDRETNNWVWTNPEGHRKYIEDLNKNLNGMFVPLVKMFKWWRFKNPTIYKAPQGFILECITGEKYDSVSNSNSENFVNLLKNIESSYISYISTGSVPVIPDPGLPDNNVSKRLTYDEFEKFINKISLAREISENALNEGNKFKSSELWRKLFGEEFPLAPEEVEKKSEDSIVGFPNNPIKPKTSGFA